MYPETMSGWADYANEFFDKVPDSDGLVILTRDGRVIETRGTEIGVADVDVSDVVQKQDRKNKKQEEGASIEYKNEKYIWIRSDDHATYYKKGKMGLTIYNGPYSADCITLIRSKPDVKPETRIAGYLNKRGAGEKK